MKRTLFCLVLLALAARGADAGPAPTLTAIGRDARRLLPRSLSRLLGEREVLIDRELGLFPPELTSAIARDLPRGALQPETLALLDGELDRVVLLLRQQRISEGLVRLGGLLRIPADLSDPALAVGPEGWPPGLVREYYALFEANLDKMPVVLEDGRALELSRRQLPGLWQSLLERGRIQVPTIRAELIQGGRVVSHRTLDYRSPAWAVASLAYSRAVTATAATWLAVWREAHGDLTGMQSPREVTPRQEPAGSAVSDRRPPPPEAP